MKRVPNFDDRRSAIRFPRQNARMLPTDLRFAWWNVHDFAHYDVARAGERRWPLEGAAYTAKCSLVDAALRDLINRHNPDLLGLCEITSVAAEELRQRLFPTYELIVPDVADDQAFQAVVFHRRSVGFRDRVPIVASLVPDSTRGMPVVDYQRRDYSIRFIFCHWTAFGDSAAIYRDRLAESVASACFQFMNKEAKRIPHTVIVGDMNAEPFDPVFENRLHAHRDRDHANQRAHYSDRDVERFRLYNVGWRLLGERFPHEAAGAPAHHAGTHYHFPTRKWRTVDQVLVTGSLLTPTTPYLEEGSVATLPLVGCLSPAGTPLHFSWANGRAHGLSDHLPIACKIRLE